MVKEEGCWGNVTMKKVDNYKYYKGHSEWVSCKRMAHTRNGSRKKDSAIN